MKNKWDWGRTEMPHAPSYKNKPSGTYKHQYNIIDDKVVEIKEVTVYTFSMGDVEDPDLYAAEPLYKWQESEMGKWVMTHAVETPVWHRIVDAPTLMYRYAVRAKLSGKDLTYFYLKWKDQVDKPIR